MKQIIYITITITTYKKQSSYLKLPLFFPKAITKKNNFSINKLKTHVIKQLIKVK